MRRVATNALLSTMLATSVLFSSSAVGRMTSNQQQKNAVVPGQMASQVDFQTFDIDG